MGNSVNLEYEKKRNIKLALGVAAFGVLGYFVVNFIFVAMMFISPWKLFSLFPFPTFSEEVTGLDGNLLIFSESIDFKGATYKSPPKAKMTLRIFNGESLTEPKEIESFTSLYSTIDRIYFFEKGIYRIFDGRKWVEVKNSAIGSKPKGAVGTEGIWVFSKIKKKPILNFITEREIKEIPLPGDEHIEDMNICSTQLIAFGKELHFFWENDDYLFWHRYDGEKWDQSRQFEDSGEYKAVVFNDQILLFKSVSFVEDHGITLWVYHEGFWSEPEILDIHETSLKTIPAVFKGRPIIYSHGFFSEKYYILNEEQVTGPFKISRPFFSFISCYKVFIFIITSTVLFFIVVFLLSILIRRFKLRTWSIDSREFEFASLFRRSLAKFIDSILIMIPAGVPFYFVLKDDTFLDNPFKLMVFVLYSTIIMILGSFFYHSLLEGLWGKTMGKLICGIVVLKDDFTKCTIWRAFLRNFMRIIDGFYGYLVGVVSMAGTIKWQRLGDLAAGTVVVRERNK